MKSIYTVLRKPLSILLLLILIPVFTACGGKDTPQGNTDIISGDPLTGDTPGTASDSGKDAVSTLTTETPDSPAVPEDSVIFYGKIMQADSNGLLIIDSREDASSYDLYHISIKDIPLTDSDGTPVTPDALTPGMLIEASYDGSVMEVYPGIFYPSSIRITGNDYDVAGLYLQVIKDLYDKDAGLNGDISMLALDLTKVNNLSMAEKSALIWLTEQYFGLYCFESTYEELSESEYVDAETKSFKEGLLITIEDSLMSDESISFDAGKWRSPLGAYYFTSCTGTFKSGSFSYTVGAHMVS